MCPTSSTAERQNSQGPDPELDGGLCDDSGSALDRNAAPLYGLRPVPPADPPPVSRRRRHSGANWLLAALALIAGLYLARTLIVPVVLAILLSVVLGPAARRLNRFVSPPIAAAGLLLGFGLIALIIGWQVAKPAQEWVDGLPAQMREIERKSRTLLSGLESYRSLAKEVDDLAATGSQSDGVVTVAVETGPSLSSTILKRTRSALGLLMAAIVLLYFMLAGSNAFLTQLIRLVPALRRNCRAETLLHKVEENVSRYFLTVALINGCLGLAVGGTVALLGVGNPVLWGVLVALLNFVPYLGAALGVSLLAVSSILSGEGAVAMLLPPVAYAALTTIEGTFITPAVLGRRFALSPVVILLALFFWGWIWGFVGTFLAVPLLVVFKIITDQVEELDSVRNLLDRPLGRFAEATSECSPEGAKA